MSSDGKLVFDPFPTEPLEFSNWFENQSRKSNECTLKIKNAADKTETVSYLSMFLLAWRWNPKTEIWSAADADIGLLKAEAIIKEAPLLMDGEKRFLHEDESLFHFNDARTHRQMQITLRAAVLRAVEGHRLSGDLTVFDKSIGMHDLYQGSRLLQRLLELASTSMRRMKVTIISAGLRLADELIDNPDLPKPEIHAVVARLAKCADALAFAGYVTGDHELASHFVDVLKAHPRPNVVAAVNAAEVDGEGEPTVAQIRMAVLKHIPLSADDHPDVQAHVSHVAPPPTGTTLLDRTCAALLSMLPHKPQQPSSVLDGGAPKVCRTLEEQQAYIKQIWNQHHQNYRDPEWLADKLKKAQAFGGANTGRILLPIIARRISTSLWLSRILLCRQSASAIVKFMSWIIWAVHTNLFCAMSCMCLRQVRISCLRTVLEKTVIRLFSLVRIHRFHLVFTAHGLLVVPSNLTLLKCRSLFRFSLSMVSITFPAVLISALLLQSPAVIK